MKGIAKRSKLMFALVAIFLAGVIVLAATFGINAETWVFKRANKHIYSSGQIVAAGTIYDRNGKALVTNRYRLDLTFDYSVLPSAQPARSQAILRALEILDACGERNRLCDTQYPLEGAYPNLVYSAAAETTGTSLNKTLLEVLETIGLRALAIQRIRTDRGVTRTPQASSLMRSRCGMSRRTI